jgi:hypothetical protein
MTGCFRLHLKTKANTARGWIYPGKHRSIESRSAARGHCLGQGPVMPKAVLKQRY